MESQGWLTVRIEPQEGKPSRKIYSITDAGMKELMRWLILMPDITPERNPLLLKVFFGRMVHPEALKRIIIGCKEYHAKLLEQYKTETVDVIQRYADTCSSPEDAAFWKLTLDFGQRFSKMVVEWCDHVLTTINHTSAQLLHYEPKIERTSGGTKHGTPRDIRKGKKKS
jgi:DNA-binding PadR family transcriptional regulator